MNLREFLRKYPNDRACLKHLVELKYSQWVCQCGRWELYPVRGRTSYACGCGKQVYPLSGTPMSRSRIALTSWFYVIWVMTHTKSGISATTIQRHLGVKYSTAWRMMMRIREIMKDDQPLIGNIEVDETYFRAKPWRTTRPLPHNGRAQVVIGLVERGGRAKAIPIPTSSLKFLHEQINKHVPKDSTVYTDTLPAYKSLKYNHHVINHSERYVDGHIHTNNIENVFSHMKRGIYGVYRSVRPEYLQHYLDEYTWRYSKRFSTNMFNDLLNTLSI